MQFVRRYRIPALFCSFCVLLIELISRPYADMGICDDGPYILVAKKLAATGHIAYNGWSAAMLLWQLYLGAAFIKLFGFSFTTVRMSTLLVAVLLAFFLQRTMVLASISERNATIGTLALVLSPLYLLLSVTFMSDIHGLFAMVLCLYGCLRALQSPSNRSAIAWLCFAVATNAICGTSRQLAWLGVLVMVPCTLWLLRDRRRVLFAGAAATLAGVLFILGSMVWLHHQPYTTPETFHVGKVSVAFLSGQFIRFFLDLPFLLLPITVLFLPGIRKMKPRLIPVVSGLALGYLFLATYPSHLRGTFKYLQEPTLGDWVNNYGGFSGSLKGAPPIFLQPWIQVILTVVVFGSLLGLITLLARSYGTATSVMKKPPLGVSCNQLGVVLIPFTIAYILLLTCRAITIAGADTPVVIDRYGLGLLLVSLILLVRYYQERVQPRLPLASVLVVSLTAICGATLTHNMFSYYRARVTIAAKVRAAGIPETSIDNGWEYNINVELQHAAYINNPAIVIPAHAYVPITPLAGACELGWYNYTPHIHPLYGISFDPSACYGPAPFAPVHYSRWLASSPGTLYVVRYTLPARP